ncbi:uncharacterized protein LOC127096459 [Lathyrus oleraceus]|uniref:uncharacterized protein LOC127096459 n=1 Tax=Pisum sativum TaxID=3888 RepID=UPI0021D3A11C|nr:uncharacterized protein LOC127096459 [Pisum sativum]
MDVVTEEQAAFREEMDSVKSKIEQIFEAIQALARREEEARVAAAARNDALVQGVALQSGPSVPIPNPVIYGLPPGFVPPLERTHVPPPAHTSGVVDGVAAQGPLVVNQVVIPRTDEELQDEFEMQNYNGATPVVIPTAAQDSEAILMCRALAKKLRILEGHNSTRLSALEMCLVPDVGQYYERLISSVSTGFSDMVIVGERVEEGLKSGKIQGGSSSQPILKKPFNGFKRKEGETSAISSQRRVPPRAPAPLPYYQYPYVAAAQYPTMPYRPIAHVPIPAPIPHYQVPVPQYQAPQPQFQAPPPQHQQRNQPRPVQQQRPNQQRPYQQYNNVNTTPIPMSYTQLLPYLIQNGTVVPRELPPMPKPHKPWYDENARCAFHANSEGHTTENCKVFKLQVQELIDQKILSFADVPNVGNNPLPKHDSSSVNAIESSTDDGLIKDVFKLKTLLTVVHARLMEAELMNGVHDSCVVCSSNPDQCGEFKSYLQRLMDQRVIQFTREKIDEDVAVVVPVFDQERLPKPFVVPYQRNVDLEPVKKIEPMVIHVPAPFSFDSTKAVPWNYEPVVYVGNKPVILKEPDVTNIAGASGVTRSGRVFAPEVIPNKESAPTVEPTKGKEVNPPEAGEGSSKKAVTVEEDREFLKIIKKTYVAEDISVIQFDNMVANLNASSCLMFTDDDLPPNGREHNMALHISIQCTDVTLARVLVDTGRPWISAAGAVTSTLHQKLKFVTSGKLVSVSGEEDIFVSHLTSFRYIEVGEDIVETPLQALEVVNVVQTKPKLVEAPKRVMSSWKSVKSAIEAGCPGSWGTLIELPEKKDKCGLGYQPSIELFKDQKIHQGKVPSIQEIFFKAGFRSDDQVNALEDEDPDLSKMVFRGPSDAALTNWKATDVPDIVSCSK